MFDRHMRRSKQATATLALGTTPAAISSRFAGRCVNTIVSMRPMRAASRDDTSCENAAQMPATKKICPAVVTEKPKRLYNHNTRSDWTTRPPPMESSEKRADSLRTIARDFRKPNDIDPATGSAAEDKSL